MPAVHGQNMMKYLKIWKLMIGGITKMYLILGKSYCYYARNVLSSVKGITDLSRIEFSYAPKAQNLNMVIYLITTYKSIPFFLQLFTY